MRKRLHALGLRGRLLLAVMSAIGLALVALTIAFNLVLDARLDSDATSVLRARAAGRLATLSTVNGVLKVGEAPDQRALDSLDWVFAGRRMLEQPAPAPALANRAAQQLADGPHRVLDVPHTRTRLLSVPVAERGRRVGTVVTGISLSPYVHTKRIALIASLVLAAVLALVALLSARWVLRAALRPVARMTAEAKAWSESGLDRRFGLGPPRDELTQLAATLDGLLDRLAAGLRHEQRFSAELSHELRTPLARISAEAQLALRAAGDDAEMRDALQTILRSTEQMARALDALIAAARAETGTRGNADAGDTAVAAVRGCALLARENGLEVRVAEPDSPLRVGAEAELVERILHPLIENACRYGRKEVSVDVSREDGRVRFAVSDDGPGVDAAERERIFESGVRGSAAAGAAPGAGLGLALARRLAHAAGGEVEVRSDPGGGRFLVHLPSG